MLGQAANPPTMNSSANMTNARNRKQTRLRKFRMKVAKRNERRRLTHLLRDIFCLHK